MTTIEINNRTYEQRRVSELVEGDVILAGDKQGVNTHIRRLVDFVGMRSQMSVSTIRGERNVRRHTVVRTSKRVVHITPVNAKNTTRSAEFSSFDRVWVEVPEATPTNKETQ